MDHPVRRRNAVHAAGAGPRTLLLAHGFGCDQQMWRFVAPDLARDHRVVTFDYVGSGKSDVTAWNPQRYGSLQGYAQDVLDVCHALDLQDVVLIGHSISGMLGLRASLAEPGRLSRLIMIAPSPCFVNDPPYAGGFEREDLIDMLDLMERNMVNWASFLAPVAMGNLNRPELGAELAASFCSGDARIARRFAELVFLADERHLLPQCAIPTLILQCTDDAIAPSGVGRYMHQTMPHSTLHYMQATGHCPHMSAPDETIALIREYLSAPYGAEPR